MTVTWNGTTISGPVLIYQDELVVDTRTTVTGTPINGTLECRSNQATVGWHLANGQEVSFSMSSDIRQIRTSIGVTPSASRLTANKEDLRRADSLVNGLWTCRMNGNYNTPIPIAVGIYGREEGAYRYCCEGLVLSVCHVNLGSQNDPVIN